MSQTWQPTTIGDECEFRGGGTPSTAVESYWRGSIPWVSPKDMKFELVVDSEDHISKEAINNSAASLIPKNSVLIVVRSGILARTIPLGIAGRELTINQDLKALCPRNGLDPRFLYYLLQAKSEYLLSKVSRGATVHRLQTDSIRSLPFSMPPPNEQQRIVAILDKAFAGIATAKANTEKNLRNARMFQQAKTDSALTSAGQMTKLGEITELARGHNPPKSKFSRTPKPGYVRFYQIRDGKSDDHAVYVPDSPQLHKMRPEDIMMVAYRHIGRVFRGVSGAFNVALCKISNARPDVLDSEYLFRILPSRYVKGELLKRSERSLIPSMSIDHLREIRIPLPSLAEQRATVTKMERLAERIGRLESTYVRKLNVLENLKKSLLNAAFAGEL